MATVTRDGEVKFKDGGGKVVCEGLISCVVTASAGVAGKNEVKIKEDTSGVDGGRVQIPLPGIRWVNLAPCRIQANRSL